MKVLMIVIMAVFFASCEPANDSTTNGNTAVNERPPLESPSTTEAQPIPKSGYQIVKRYPHDGKAFTQGLLFHEGMLYESTGQYGQSTLRKVDIPTGKVLKKFDLSSDFFAEGIALIGDEIYQLTWRSQVGFVYSLKDFKFLREFRYAGEGWGLTYDGTNLYHSDGTHVIRVVEPKSYKTIRTISVYDENKKPLREINELEWVKGEIWANIWHSDQIGKPNHIARISPKDGKLLGWIDLSGISPADVKRDEENTMNGVAYDSKNDRIFVTGKNWKNLYEIKLTDINQ